MKKCEKFVEIMTEFGIGHYDEAVFTVKKDYVGYYTREDPFDKDGTESVFGRCDELGYMTHMCYNRSAIYPNKEWSAFLDPQKANGWDYFYFDAGGNGRPVRTHIKEIDRAFRELGLNQ